MSDIKRDVKSSVKDFTQGSVSKVVKESTKKLIKNLPEKQKKLLEDRIVNMSDDQLEQYFADDPYFKDALENTIKSVSDIPPKKSPGFWKKRTELVSKCTSENLATTLSPQVVISIILAVASVALLAILFLKPPVANFTTSVPNAPLTIQFNDISSYHPTSWEWDFGDNNTSTEQNLTHKYSKAGNYTVTLTASNVAGSNTTTKENISVNKTLQTPVANFSSNVTSGKAPLSVKFTDKSTEIPTKWNWSFGDGKASTQQNPEHQYSKAGMYTVTFTASNAAGSNTTTKENYMKVTGKTVANFTSNVTRSHVPLTVQFTDFSQNATGWNWDFGDGTSSSDQSPVHVYFPAGTYNVNLTVTNENETDSKFATIVALGKKDNDHNPKILPVANFTSNLIEGPAPLTVQFIALSQNATEWNWNFGDRTHSIVDNPIHEYSTPGNYTVALTASNAAGSNTTTKENYIKVEPVPKNLVAPVAAFSASPTSGSIPLKVQFTDNSTGNPEEWKWDFGDETISTEKNPVNIYFKAGNHTVNLTVTNKNGTNSTSATITVRCA
ncbi:PKD domain-containing protein [Methanosarcina vacuolata]|uniref:PKD domain-containing protein n=1 Tax=Methanosarcina vacuolata Z-761 TaxID=1434123 RepID=A0A0E3Q4P9_9EURY|nr:PKD domain-containing protein [Methanosarcina vacuolata]AKB43540.1 hypothetical protein MSVAZ_1271 [Methanosarcina vacuolata Z-761]